MLLELHGENGYSKHSFAITVEAEGARGGTRRRFVFTCGKVGQKKAWMDALEISVIQARIDNDNGIGDSSDDMELGWQHDLLRTSLFSAVICNDASMIQRALLPTFSCKTNIDALDSYGGRTALHYAVMENHLVAVKALLAAGADPNVLDANQKRPLHHG